MLGSLVGGFALLVVGLAALTMSPSRGRQDPARGMRRALSYAGVYGLCTAAFFRVLQPALLGHERSPWMLALGDVIFVTLALFTWVMVLAEGRPLSSYGLGRVHPGRLLLTMLMGLGAVAVYSLIPYARLLTGRATPTPDGIVFALLFAVLGSAFPEEMIFRGYLQGSLSGRVSLWARVAIPALIFTAVRAMRFWPEGGLGWPEWMGYIFGVALPLGMWWGLMRELSGGAIWACLLSHILLELGPTLAGTSPALP
jgi:membrane protease YdiL (CAAX protease family)